MNGNRPRMAHARAEAFMDGIAVYLRQSERKVLCGQLWVEDVSDGVEISPTFRLTTDQALDLYHALARELGMDGPEGRSLQKILDREQDRVDYLIGRTNV